MSTIASTCSSRYAAPRSSANEAGWTGATFGPAASIASTAAVTASFGAAISSPRTVLLSPGSSSGKKSSSERSTGSGSMSRTWNGSDLRSSRSGRLATDISRTTICGCVTPRTTSRPRNLAVAHNCRSAAVTTLASWTTPACTAPSGSSTSPTFVMTGPSLPRLVSTARMDIEPMSSPIGFVAAIGCSFSRFSGGLGEQGGVPGRDRPGEEHGDQRAGEHGRTERDGAAPAGPAGGEQHRTGQATDEGTGERADQHPAPAEPAEGEAEQASE